MSYNKEDYIRVKEEFSQKYRRAQLLAEERRLELYGHLPRVRELDGILARTGMDIMAVIAEGGETRAKVEELHRRNDALLAERGKILRENGYPEDYSDVQYECRACGDTGFIDIRMCDCMRRALAEAGYESSGLGALIRTQSFENFSLDYYKESGKAETMRQNVEMLRQFADRFDKGTYHNFLLFGGTGLGKTHLSTAVAKTVIERGHDVVYVTAVSLFRDFNAKQFDKGVGMKNDPDRYFEAELLIVDDLGTEVTNQFTLSCLYDLINQRINQHRCTFLNTNLSYKEFDSRYNERITSRIFGEYSLLLFSGTDIRRQKLQHK